MSVSQKENKEKVVQLTQEDIQILSEYSWDTFNGFRIQQEYRKVPSPDV